MHKPPLNYNYSRENCATSLNVTPSALTYTCIPTYTHTYMHTHTHIHARMHNLHTYTYMLKDRHTYTHTNTYVHTYLHTYMHTDIHVHTCLHAHMHVKLLFRTLSTASDCKTTTFRQTDSASVSGKNKAEEKKKSLCWVQWLN